MVTGVLVMSSTYIMLTLGQNYLIYESFKHSDQIWGSGFMGFDGTALICSEIYLNFLDNGIMS